jgi:hypothetical protein
MKEIKHELKILKQQKIDQEKLINRKLKILKEKIG